MFDRVQETLRARDVAGTRQRRHEHSLKGLLHCGECGRRLSLTLAKGRYLYFYCLGQRGTARTGCRQPYILAGDAEALVEDLYRQIQLPRSWVRRLTEELEAEIVERQAEASERRVLLTKTLAKLAEERGKLLQAFYANAIPLDLLKAEQDRIGAAEQAVKAELETTEGDLDGWQDILRTAIRLAGNCRAAYLKARPSVRRRFNDAVLEAVYIRDRKIGRANFSEVFAPLFSRPSSNKRLKVEVGGFEPPSPGDLSGLLRAQPVGRSRLEAPTGGGPLGQPGFDVRRRPPGGAVAVSLLTTPILPSQATERGRLPSYLGSERVFVIGACIGPGF